MEGIYSLDGDMLRLCYVRYDLETEAKRPVGFATEKGSQQVLLVLKRTHGPEVFPYQLADGSRAFPSVIEVNPTEYVIMSRLLEAGANGPKELLGFPKMTLTDGQFAPLHITDGPQNLLTRVVEDEKLKIGTYFDVRVTRLGENKVRLSCSLQKNEVEKSSVSEIRVLGNSVQATQVVELHKPVKIVLQKDAGGSALRWLEITVDGIRVD
jgi:hypothetical protein